MFIDRFFWNFAKILQSCIELNLWWNYKDWSNGFRMVDQKQFSEFSIFCPLISQHSEYAKCMICYIIKVVGIRFLSLFNSQQCWEFADFAENFKKIDRIYGYSMNLDSLSIHWFQVPTVLTVKNLWILIEFRFIQYPQIPWNIIAAEI